MMSVLNSNADDVKKKFANILPQSMDNNESMRKTIPCIQFAEAVKVIYGPFIKNKVVIQHVEKLKSQTEPSDVTLPGINDPYVQEMLAVAKTQEKKFGGGNNFVLMLCGSFLKQIQCLKNAGISCNDIHFGYSVVLEETLKILKKSKVDVKEDSVKDSSKHKINVNKLQNSKSENKKKHFISCQKLPSKKVIISRKNELLVAKKEGKGYYGTEIILNTTYSTNSPSCDLLLNCDEILELLQYRLSCFTNRKMKTDTEPVNVVLYTCNINCSSIAEVNNDYCIVHDIYAKLGCINLYAETNKVAYNAKVVVALGQIDKIALSKMNKEGILVVTIEDQFELQRLQKATGGTLISNFTTFLKEDDIGQALSVTLEDLDGMHVAIFKIKKKDSDIETVVLKDVTTVNDTLLNKNSKMKGDKSKKGVDKSLIVDELNELAKKFTHAQRLVIKNFLDTMEAFSTTLQTTFPLPEKVTVDDNYLREKLDDFNIKDQCLLGYGLKNSNTNLTEEEFWALTNAANFALRVFNANKPS